MYCTTEKYERETSLLKDCFQKSLTIARLHAFIPKTITTKRFSFLTTSKDVQVMKECGELEMEEVSGYVICIHNNQWWLLEKDLENEQVKLSLLHPGRSFQYPHTPEIVTVGLSCWLNQELLTTGRTYTIP